MNDQSKHIKLHVDSMIRLRALEFALDSKKIPCIIKNLTESARLAGFGSINYANELYVYQEDKVAALEVLNEFLKE